MEEISADWKAAEEWIHALAVGRFLAPNRAKPVDTREMQKAIFSQFKEIMDFKFLMF